jgi:hypothetical protein
VKIFWRRLIDAIPLGVALFCVALVAAGGWVWSFEEQTRRAESLGFEIPWLLPLVLDGLSLSLAGVAFAAALDGRPAVSARIGTAVAVLASAASNAEAAWARSDGKTTTVVIASVVPIAANLAFEVFLGEMRRQVHRGRGLPAPAAVTGPRLIRLALSPIKTSREWKAYVLEATAIPGRADPIESTTDQPNQTGSAPEPDPAERPRPSAGSVTKADRDDNPTGSQTPDPIVAPPVVSIGSGGSTDRGRSDPPAARRTEPIEATDPDAKRSNRVPDSWVRPTGSDEDLVNEIWRAIKRGWISLSGRLTEADVTALVVAGGPRARKLRDIVNSQREDQDATDGDNEPERVSG